MQSTLPPENTRTPISAFRNRFDTMGWRFFIIGFLAFLLLIPVSMVKDVVKERHALYTSVLYDIATSWGQQQSLQGPILVVPFIERTLSTKTTKQKDGSERTTEQIYDEQKYAFALPKKLVIKATLDDKHRYRGIYESLVYQSHIHLSGYFERPTIETLSDKILRIDWHKAFVIVGLTDTHAIQHSSELLWNGKNYLHSPGIPFTKFLATGFHTKIPDLDPQAQQYTFTQELALNGSKGFYFAPFGEETEAHIESQWPHPSFQGSFLPSETKIEDSGFTATWRIPHLARNYPQLWVSSDKQNLSEVSAGVALFEPVALYSQVTRAVKYALLFIILTFLTFLVFELSIKKRLHIIQYALVGGSMCLFYITLLSLAEHISFLHAYFAASIVIIIMITLYTAVILKSLWRSVLIMALLASLYTTLYSLLRMEDYALLVGTGLLLLAMAVLMYLTRHLHRQDDH